MPHDTASRRQAILAAALADLHANRFRRVPERCATLLARDPSDAEARLLSRLAAGALTPDDPAARFAFASFLHENGRSEDAIPALADLLRLRPDDLPARNLLAIALATLGRTGEAIAAASRYRHARSVAGRRMGQSRACC